jgi:hypothetical protein
MYQQWLRPFFLFWTRTYIGYHNTDTRVGTRYIHQSIRIQREKTSPVRHWFGSYPRIYPAVPLGCTSFEGNYPGLNQTKTSYKSLSKIVAHGGHGRFLKVVAYEWRDWSEVVRCTSIPLDDCNLEHWISISSVWSCRVSVSICLSGPGLGSDTATRSNEGDKENGLVIHDSKPDKVSRP